MSIVFLTALGVGGATVFGAIIGYLFKGFALKSKDTVLSFAAGVMLSSSIIGLILPSLQQGGRFPVAVTITGIFSGALCIKLLSSIIPRILKNETDFSGENLTLHRVIVFVSAIAIHNLPEGIAAGVGFGTGNTADALFIALGIAIQNIPEGMVIIPPMLSCGVSPFKAFLTAVFTGLIEVIGTFIGYFAVSISAALLPFALSFAGGTMIYVICGEMIPETNENKSNKWVTFSLILGFCLILLI